MTPFAAPYAPPDEQVVPALIEQVRRDVDAEERIDATARRLIEGIRERAGSIGGLEDFLRDYGLSTREGLALMAMAEALLRVPDAATQDALIADKIGQGAWEDAPEADTWFVSAAVWGLGLSTRMIRPKDTAHGILSNLTKRVGAPAVRQGVRQAMRYLGHQFVLGETIEDALERARGAEAKGARHSYDMLGEGARTWDDARRYAKSYADAIEAIGRRAGNKALPDRPGISVKLSALHPRYEARNRAAVLAELTPALTELARAAKGYDLNFTVDAEEQDRLELSLDVIAAAFADPSLRGWQGFGLAVQAYGKRSLAVIDWVAALAREHGETMMVRLVKGAYWDAEVKHAQVEGAHDFPVWTRKPVTDIAFLACAGRMLESRASPGKGGIYPQIATHNALTVATVMEMADATGEGREGYEFQRLHGMGEELYEQVTRGTSSKGGVDGHGAVPCRVYAPVGGHRDLLAYLVRRLLENGANSSFVARVGDRKVSVEALLERPARLLEGAEPRHPKIARSSGLFGARRNSLGVEFGSREELDALVQAMRAAPVPAPAEPVSGRGGERGHGAGRGGVSPMARHARRDPRRGAGARGGPAGGAPPPPHGDPRARGRQDDRRRRGGGARGGRLPALLRRRGAPADGRAAPARPGRRGERLSPARARHVRDHRAVELPAGDLPGPDGGGAGRRQRRGRQARAADAGDRPRGRGAAA